MTATKCPFCEMDPKRILLSSPNTLAFFDNFPVTEGHTLIFPKRHVTSVFDLPDSMQAELWSQVAKVRTLLTDNIALTVSISALTTVQQQDKPSITPTSTSFHAALEM